MLESKVEEKQYSAARVLWTLSFDQEVKQSIEQEPGAMENLERLANSTNSGVKKMASGTLWKIRENTNKREASTLGKKCNC